MAVTPPPFPDVPNDPGVPPVPRSGVAPATSTPVLSADSPNVATQSSQTAQWGVFKDGVAVILPDSIVAVEKAKEFRLSDYPVEDGSFQSYNKVETPFDAHVTMAMGGDASDRAAFLDTLEDVTKSMALYDVVTPEKSYLSASIERYDYERSAKSGVTLLTVRLWLREIRVTATAAFSKTKTPAGSGVADDGTVQPRAPTGTEATVAGQGAF